MAKTQDISISRLRECVNYDPGTGKLYWKKQGEIPNPLPWHARCYGKEAFCWVNPDGYLTGTFQRSCVRAHRVAFVLMTGEWPIFEVDHINGIRTDNRWCNLRLAPNGANARNAKAKTGNRYIGAFKMTGRKTWKSKITVNGKTVQLGHFEKAEDAAVAHDFAAVRKDGNFARLNFPERKAEYESYLGNIGSGGNSWMLNHYVA